MESQINKLNSVIYNLEMAMNEDKQYIDNC